MSDAARSPISATPTLSSSGSINSNPDLSLLSSDPVVTNVKSSSSRPSLAADALIRDSPAPRRELLVRSMTLPSPNHGAVPVEAALRGVLAKTNERKLEHLNARSALINVLCSASEQIVAAWQEAVEARTTSKHSVQGQ